MCSEQKKLCPRRDAKGREGKARVFRRAFSLVEIMVVLVLIGLLAGAVAVNVRHFLVKGKQNTARLEVSNLCAAVETYYSSMGRYPTNEEGLAILSRKSE